MDKNQRNTQKMVFKNLNTIYATSKSISLEWGQKAIPLNTLREIINKSQLKPTENPRFNEFALQFNKTLDKAYTTCESKAKEMDSNSVSVAYIKIVVEHVKSNMF